MRSAQWVDLRIELWQVQVLEAGAVKVKGQWPRKSGGETQSKKSRSLNCKTFSFSSFLFFWNDTVVRVSFLMAKKMWRPLGEMQSKRTGHWNVKPFSFLIISFFLKWDSGKSFFFNGLENLEGRLANPAWLWNFLEVRIKKGLRAVYRMLHSPALHRKSSIGQQAIHKHNICS